MAVESQTALLDAEAPYIAMKRLEPGHETFSVRDMHVSMLDLTGEMRELTRYTREVNKVTAIEAMRLLERRA